MRVAWVLLLLCGCTAFLDLRLAPNGDRDGDGVADDNDNCPDAYNPDQSDFDLDQAGDACDQCSATEPDVDDDGIPDPCDGCIGNGIDVDMDNIDDNCQCVPMGVDTDGDGLDDNCDPCLLGPQHDEDGDGVMDACDNCPGIPNATQANVDALVDTVGDACDPDMGTTARTFDNFMSENSAWFQLGAGWARVNGSYVFAAKTATYRALGTTTANVRVIAGVRFLYPGTGTVFELFSSDEIVPSPQNDARCTLSDTGMLTAKLTPEGQLGNWPTQSSLVGFDVSGHIVVMLDVNPKTGSMECTAIDSTNKMLEAGQSGTISENNNPGIGGVGGAEVTFYDLLIHQ